MKNFVALAGGFCVFVFAGVKLAYVCCVVDFRGQPDDGREKLRTLAYVESVEVPPEARELSGVTGLVKGKVSAGINVYAPMMGNTAQLLDMHGNRVHVLTDRRKKCSQRWEIVKPYVDSQFLVVAGRSCKGLFLIDWESNVIWESKMNFHHDVSFDANGNIFALSRELIRDSRIALEEPILDDRLVILSPDGQVKKELSFAAMFVKDPALLDIIHREDTKEYGFPGAEQDPQGWDVVHANTVEVLTTKMDSVTNPSFRAGNVLFCSRHLDLIGVIDVEAERVVWHWGPGELDNPHGPTLLDNGHVLVLDNGMRRGRSRIVEMDPESGRIVNTIGDDRQTAFFTPVSGGLQRLPNGNTLIVEGQGCFVFEVTPDGTVVWEFYSFPFFQEGEWIRPTLYRMPRIVDDDNFPELQTILSKTLSPKRNSSSE